MVKGTTFADVFHAYTKPSLGGRLIIRKATSRQTSARLKERQDAVRIKGEAGGIATKAHDELVAKGLCPDKRVYKPGEGYVVKPVCPIEEMKKALRDKMTF